MCIRDRVYRVVALNAADNDTGASTPTAGVTISPPNK